jgi:hypothetical protein
MACRTLVLAVLLPNLCCGAPLRRSGPDAAPSGFAPAGTLDGVGIKPGVILRGLDERMYPAIREAQGIWLKFGGKLVITSGLDGRHVRRSRHYIGLALDFRSRDLAGAARHRVAQELRQALGEEFQVLVEKDHIHVQCDMPHSASQAPAIAADDSAVGFDDARSPKAVSSR